MTIERASFKKCAPSAPIEKTGVGAILWLDNNGETIATQRFHLSAPSAPSAPIEKTHIQTLFFTFYFFLQMSKISEVIPGATIIGRSGKKLIVDRIEGDLIICGDRRIGIEAVVEVITPPPPAPIFKLGDRVRFVGDFRDWGIEWGTCLTVVEDCGEWIMTRTDGKKPITLLRSDLKLAQQPIDDVQYPF